MDINAGDLVMVVRTCCDSFVRTPVFVVTSVDSFGLDGRNTCNFCGAFMPAEMQANDAKNYGYPLSWLKRIEPLSEPQHVDESQKVTA